MTTMSTDGAPKIDMSPETIDRRLRELGKFYEFGISIQKAKKVGKVTPSPLQPPHLHSAE